VDDTSNYFFGHSLEPQIQDCWCRSIACGARHNLALMRDGQVYCWGWALHGQCGPGPSETAAVQHESVQNEAVQNELLHSYLVDNCLETEVRAPLSWIVAQQCFGGQNVGCTAYIKCTAFRTFTAHNG
jgi:alpha-tubulin suppressor-like RCC1 family protein